MRAVHFFIPALAGLIAFSPAIPANAEFSTDHFSTGHFSSSLGRGGITAIQEVVRPANASISTGCPSTPTPGSTVPAFRLWPGIAYDGATANVVLFGGYCFGQNALNDTWTWNGSVWTQTHPASAPAQRYGMGMAYDAAIGKIVLFGGFETTYGGFQGYDNDTWTWDGSNWTQISTAHTPPARSNMGMAYDAGNSVIVLFGGGNGTDMSDTWTFNGTDWSLQKGKGPAARDGQAMVYDPAQPGVILFGGVTAACSTCPVTNFGDTWVWNKGWTQLKPATSPSGRGEMGMAYDTFSGYLLLFGGQSEAYPTCCVTMYNDTWTWNGTTWTKLNPVNSPQAQEGFGMEYDANSAARTVVQVGNGTGDGQSGTWVWNGTTWTAMAGIGVPIAETPGGQSPTEYSTSRQCGCYPVNDATGEFWHSFTDLAIPGRGVSLLFTRTYSSMSAAQDSPLGFGWTDSYNINLSTDTTTGNITVHQANGSAVTFIPAPSGYLGPNRVMATLVKNGDGTFMFTDRGGLRNVFSAAGQLASESDRNGYVTSLAYAGGKLSTIKDPAGRTLTLSYGTNGRIASVADSASRSVSFLYDSTGNLTQATDVGGGNTKFSYDTSHRMLTMTDPNNGILQNQYDSTGRVSAQIDPMNRTTQYTYNSNQTVVTDPSSHQTCETYNSNELTQVRKGPCGSFAPTWNYAYDAATLGLTSITDPNGHVTINAWDANGNLLTHSDGLSRVTSYTYDSLNDVLTISDSLNVTTTKTYDPNGNLLSTSRPLTGTSLSANTSYTYDPNHLGDLVQITDPDGKVWKYSYDQYGERSSVTDPLNDIATYAFDSIGRMTSLVSPRGNVIGGNPAAYTTSYTYDAFGDPLSVTDPLSHQTLSQYDGDRNLTKVTDANNRSTTYVYDKDNERTQVVRPDNTTMTTDYNGDGTILDQKDGKNNAILTYGYDSLGRVVSVTDALGNVTSYTYDGAGNRLTRQDPGGNCGATPATGCTTFTYDAANQLTAISYSDGVTPNVTAISYDNDGQRIGMTDGTGSSSWAWDSLHRLTSYTNGAGVQVQYAYNLRDLPTTLTYPGGLKVTRGYDDAGRLTSIQDWLSNTTSFGYDPNSNLTTETLPPGTGVVDTGTFDAANRLMSISDAKGASVIFSASYSRDSANQLTADSSVPGSVGSYAYTNLNQLCYAGSSSSTACSSPPTGSTVYAYDAADNLVQMGSAQQAFNNADELCWTGSLSGSCASPLSGATTYMYDARGNRTSITPSSGGGTTLSYNQANRLAGYGSSGTYVYNGDGLRMSKTVSGSTTQFVWDTASALPLLLKDGSTAFVYGPGGLPLEQVNGSSVLWLHHDQLGSTRLVTDSAGTSQATYSFDAYGNMTSSTGTVSNPFRFAGQYQDLESGLYYLRARYYDPTTGQFLNRDPALASTREPYAYVAGNPLNGTDPTGLCDLNPFSSSSCARVIAGGLAQLPGAVLSDAQHGQENFIKNVQDPALRPLVAVGAVALGAAAVLATGGLAAAAGVETIGGASAGVSQIRMMGALAAAGIVVFWIIIQPQCANSDDNCHRTQPTNLKPDPNGPPLVPTTPSPTPCPSPTFGPPAPSAMPPD